MSLTPDRFFNGENTCSCCNKPMYVNDIGIVFRPSYKIIDDFLFCVECATQMTMAIVQDLSRLNPDIAFAYYDGFTGSKDATSLNLRRHAEALKALAERMEGHAEMVDQFGR